MADAFMKLVRKSAAFDSKRFGKDIQLFQVSLAVLSPALPPIAQGV